jgi:hypothetical protein
MVFHSIRRLFKFDDLPRHRLNDRRTTEAFWQKWSSADPSRRAVMILRPITLVMLFFGVTLAATYLVG